jgi:polyhydroxybutyrate depolymerase
MDVRRIRSLGATLACLACAVACGAEQTPTRPSDVPPSPASGRYATGLTDDVLVVGATRRFRVYVPASVDVRPPTAVVLVLHGGGGEGLDVSLPGEHPLSVFRLVADREGFVVVYPEGMSALDGRLGWVDCRADNRMASSADDIGFLAALVDHLRTRLSVPASRVFLAGGSNGGQMVLAFAAHAADRVAAIAVAGANDAESPLPGPCTTGPARPVPALLVHGTNDPVMPFAGGCVANLGGGCARGRVVSAEATRQGWIARNGLSSEASLVERVDLDVTDAGPAERVVHRGAAPVEWWRLAGAGHVVPSRLVLRPPSAATGTQNRDIEFAEVAWAFFAARLPAGS